MSTPHSENLSPVDWVSGETIRSYFNTHLLEKVQAEELVTFLKRDDSPAILPDGEPEDTRSQIVYYYTQDNTPVAVAHRYLRPDGTLGGCGLPDPKCIFLEDRIMKVRSRPMSNSD